MLILKQVAFGVVVVCARLLHLTDQSSILVVEWVMVGIFFNQVWVFFFDCLFLFLFRSVLFNYFDVGSEKTTKQMHVIRRAKSAQRHRVC